MNMSWSSWLRLSLSRKALLTAPFPENRSRHATSCQIRSMCEASECPARLIPFDCCLTYSHNSNPTAYSTHRCPRDKSSGDVWLTLKGMAMLQRAGAEGSQNSCHVIKEIASSKNTDLARTHDYPAACLFTTRLQENGNQNPTCGSSRKRHLLTLAVFILWLAPPCHMFGDVEPWRT